MKAGKGEFFDPLAWVDRDVRDERKRLKKVSELQSALADHLESLGKWDIFLTGTFRPNEFEEIVQQVDGSHVENEKVSWLNPENRILKRVNRHGNHHYGMRDPAPGWSASVCQRVVERFLTWKPLRRSRWFYVVEGHKHRACAHWHALIGNCGHFEWARADDKWNKRYGRMSIEIVREDLGVKHYLAKGYVGKTYGTGEDIKFGHSKNCLRPKDVAGSKVASLFQVEIFKTEKRGEDGSRFREQREQILRQASV